MLGSFGRENGAATIEELRVRIEANRHVATSLEHQIGCFILSQPFFFNSPIAQPEDWRGAIQGGRYYQLNDVVGQRVWRDVNLALAATRPHVTVSPFGGYGAPVLHPSRLGQGAFRKLVLDAYGRRCAVSGEHTVPVLQASHIKPFADVEQHEISNGLALRSDIHTLFDLGYVTVTPDYRFEVSQLLREDFDNEKFTTILLNGKALSTYRRIKAQCQIVTTWSGTEQQSLKVSREQVGRARHSDGRRIGQS